MTLRNSLMPGAHMLLILLFSTCFTRAQLIHPDPGFLFDDTELPRIDLTISASNLQSLYADPESNTEYFAQFIFTRGSLTEGPLDVALRFRGDTIRYKEKKSFRISFNSYDSDYSYHGIEKMDLNAEVNDPSLLRSKLGWDLFRFMGVPGSRSNHVLLYINNAFYGVYLNTEHIDERFTKSRFDNNDGNLYRNRWPADLAYLGTSGEDYKYEYDGRRAYALRTNEEWDDYEDLARLITTLHLYNGSQLKAKLERLMNVQQFLKVMAVDVVTGNWDGYSGNKNNYYLYRDQVSGRFEYIPYNLENSFGIDFREVDWSNRSIYAWNLDPRPLFEKVLELDEYKAQYTMYIKQLAAYITSTEFGGELTRLGQLIRDAVAIDTFYSKDWGFSIADFDNALTGGWGEHVDAGVQEFIAARVSSALDEAIDGDAQPIFTYVKVEPRSDRLELEWTVEDDEEGFSTSLHYQIDGGDWNSILKGAPDETDPVSGIDSYRDTISFPKDTVLIELYFTAEDLGGQETRYPDSTLSFTYPLVNGPLYINEYAASNSSIKKDEFGEFDDWAEIYNASNEQVWLADYFLSDNMGSPGKYRFPAEYLQPGGFFLVWLDDQEEQGINHATFKISKEGEELRLSGSPSTGFRIVDSVSFGLQETDISMGRQVDGEPDWISFLSPTPGYSNLSTDLQQIPAWIEPISLYPNPVSEGLIYFSRQVSGAIYNMMGQKIMEIEEAGYARVPQLGEGMYIFRTADGESIRFIVSR